MTDYYEELELDRSVDLKELNRQLSKAESQWKKRSISAPDKAVKKLALIVDARKAFATEASRAAYDRQLAESNKATPHANASPESDNATKWVQEARTYCDSGQFDLARIALEKALTTSRPLGTPNLEDDPELCLLAARIYDGTNNLSTALDWSNKAIVSDPRGAAYEIEKVVILDRLAENDRSKRGGEQFRGRSRDCVERAIRKAKQAGDSYNEGIAYGLLAFIRYFRLGERGDDVEQLAKRAVQLGDAWGNGKRVADDITQKRQEARQTAAWERQEALRKAIEKNRCKEREEAKRVAAEEKQDKITQYENRVRKNHFIGWAIFFACWLLEAYPSFLTFSGFEEQAEFFSTYNCVFNGLLLGFGIICLHYSDSAWKTLQDWNVPDDYVHRDDVHRPIVPWVLTVIATYIGSAVIMCADQSQLGVRYMEDLDWTIFIFLFVVYLFMAGMARYMGRQICKSKRAEMDGDTAQS